MWVYSLYTSLYYRLGATCTRGYIAHQLGTQRSCFTRIRFYVKEVKWFYPVLIFGGDYFFSRGLYVNLDFRGFIVFGESQ